MNLFHHVLNWLQYRAMLSDRMIEASRMTTDQTTNRDHGRLVGPSRSSLTFSRPCAQMF